MKTLKDYGVYETPKLSTDKIVELMNLKDEDIDFSDIPRVTDFSNYRFVNEEELKKVPKDILRAMWEERMRTVEIVEELARKQAIA
jgi:hypothetical protein